jgi:hypothetical protein
MMPINGRAFCLRYAAEKVEGVELRRSRRARERFG